MTPGPLRRIGSKLQRLARPSRSDPPLRLAHVLFVLWVCATVAWAFYVAGLAIDLGWWDQRPLEAALVMLLPPALGHALGIWITQVTGNPRF